jgi:hypothetical protein
MTLSGAPIQVTEKLSGVYTICAAWLLVVELSLGLNHIDQWSRVCLVVAKDSILSVTWTPGVRFHATDLRWKSLSPCCSLHLCSWHGSRHGDAIQSHLASEMEVPFAVSISVESSVTLF